jgi:5-methyltetrahydropteroyltriglutamate--homocysteine methyltransferase
LITGVASYPTELVEHPELVADAIIAFAELVGRENITPEPTAARGRLHPQIAWAKLPALRDGAAVASKSCGVEFKSACDERNKKQESLEVKF